MFLTSLCIHCPPAATDTQDYCKENIALDIALDIAFDIGFDIVFDILFDIRPAPDGVLLGPALPPRLASGSVGVAALQLLADPVTPLSADVAASVEEDHQPWHIFGLEPSASGVKQGLGGSLHAWPNGLLAETTGGRGHRPING